MMVEECEDREEVGGGGEEGGGVRWGVVDDDNDGLGGAVRARGTVRCPALVRWSGGWDFRKWGLGRLAAVPEPPPGGGPRGVSDSLKGEHGGFRNPLRNRAKKPHS